MAGGGRGVDGAAVGLRAGGGRGVFVLGDLKALEVHRDLRVRRGVGGRREVVGAGGGQEGLLALRVAAQQHQPGEVVGGVLLGAGPLVREVQRVHEGVVGLVVERLPYDLGELLVGGVGARLLEQRAFLGQVFVAELDAVFGGA